MSVSASVSVSKTAKERVTQLMPILALTTLILALALL
jgi:hypothetical protein